MPIRQVSSSVSDLLYVSRRSRRWPRLSTGVWAGLGLGGPVAHGNLGDR